MTQPTTKRLATEAYVAAQMTPTGALAETIRDTISTALVAGTNITITVNDAGDTITVAVSGLTKSSVGLANVDNTSDVNKPVSTAQQAALDTKDGATYTKKSISSAYTLVLGDATNTVIHSTAAGGITVTLPQNSSVAIPQETIIPWRQYGAGQITFAAGTGATLISRGALTKSAGQYAEGTLIKTNTNEWLLSGDIA